MKWVCDHAGMAKCFGPECWAHGVHREDYGRTECLGEGYSVVYRRVRDVPAGSPAGRKALARLRKAAPAAAQEEGDE